MVAFPRGVVLGIVRAGHVDNARAGLIRPRTRADLRPRAPEAVAASQQTRCNLSDHDSDYRSEHQSERERGCTYAVVFDIGKSLSSDPETSLHCVFNFLDPKKHDDHIPKTVISSLLASGVGIALVLSVSTSFSRSAALYATNDHGGYRNIDTG